MYIFMDKFRIDKRSIKGIFRPPPGCSPGSLGPRSTPGSNEPSSIVISILDEPNYMSGPFRKGRFGSFEGVTDLQFA